MPKALKLDSKLRTTATGAIQFLQTRQKPNPKPNQKSSQKSSMSNLPISTQCEGPQTVCRSQSGQFPDTLKSPDTIKSDLMAMISRELRTPLNGIIGVAELMAYNHEDEDVRQKSKIILESGNDLTRIIESILDISRINSGALQLYPEAVKPYTAINNEVEFWQAKASEKDLAFTAFIDDALKSDIILDITRFTQCLRNLLSNAVKFTHSGRIHLHIKATRGESDTLQIQTIVADTGQGISEDTQSNLFIPAALADGSMTRKYDGMGLSLAITRSLAQMMDGDVTFVSTPQRGSEFILTVNARQAETHKLDDLVEDMPALDLHELDTDIIEPENNTQDRNIIPINRLKPMSQPREPQRPIFEGLTVLIAEDMATNRDIIRLFLEPTGCNYLEAENGEIALDYLKTHDVDIILMDTHMPDMDGLTATKLIRTLDSKYQDTPIIALAADASAKVNAKCLNAGMDMFLAKPVVSSDLKEAMSYLLGHRQHSRLDGAAAR